MNVIVGIGVAFVSQLVIFSSFGLHVSYLMNLYMTLFFTAVSIVRSFLLRRIFNWFTEHTAGEVTEQWVESALWHYIMNRLGTKSYLKTFEELEKVLPAKHVADDVFLLTGETIPARETEAINHLTRRYGYEKQGDGTWKLMEGFDRESWRQYCRRKK